MPQPQKRNAASIPTAKAGSFTRRVDKQDKDIQNQWQKLEVYIEQMNTQRWKDFAFTMAIFAFQQGPGAGADSAKTLMAEILKLIGQLSK